MSMRLPSSCIQVPQRTVVVTLLAVRGITLRFRAAPVASPIMECVDDAQEIGVTDYLQRIPRIALNRDLVGHP